MSRRWIWVAMCLGLVFNACTDDNTSSNNKTANNNTTNNTKEPTNQRIACDAVTWCTTWDADRSKVEPVPELSGGSIADGLYRLQQGTFSSAALLIQGGRVLYIEDNYNQEGQWRIDGNTLTTSYTQRCGDGLELDNDWDFEISYEFLADGDKLYLKDKSCSNGSGDTDACIRMYQRVSDLCSEDQYFSCRVSNCACLTRQNKGFPGSCTF